MSHEIYKTLYEITTREPLCSHQVWQDLFHCHADLWRFNSFSNLLTFELFAASVLLSCIVLSLWMAVRNLTGRPQLGASAQFAIVAVCTVIFSCAIVAGVFYLGEYPYHVSLAQKYAKGEYLTVEGPIKDARIAEGGRTTLQKAIFKVDGETITIYSNQAGFDDPSNEAIGNGQRVRICYIDGHGNAPTILRFDVLPPYLGHCDRATVNW